MAALHWQLASPSCNTINIIHTFNNNITSQGHSHSHSLFHFTNTLLAYTRGMHIALTKITGFCTPLFFIIEMHNVIPTIAYYVFQASTSSNNSASTTPLSSDTIITPTKKSYKNLKTLHMIMSTHTILLKIICHHVTNLHSLQQVIHKVIN